MAVAELAVLVVTYDCRRLVLDCLDSLAAQRGDVRLDVLVVDNDSGDGTLEAIGERHPWVRVRSAGGNVGFSKANNLGLLSLDAPYVLLLNPDTVVPPGGLRRCLDALVAHPAIGMLGCKLVRPDGTLDHAAKRGFPTPLASAAYLVGLHRRFPRSRRLAAYTAGHVGDDETSEVDAVNGAFMLVRRPALEAVGTLDERFWMYGEDLDWCRRFWTAGWPVLYWPEVAVTHVKGGSSTSLRSWRTNRAFHGAMWRYHRKHHALSTPPLVTAFVGVAIGARLLASGLRSAFHRPHTS